jgi:hypothetical protein
MRVSIFRNLFEQFRRIANVYFAVIGFIQGSILQNSLLAENFADKF